MDVAPLGDAAMRRREQTNARTEEEKTTVHLERRGFVRTVARQLEKSSWNAGRSLPMRDSSCNARKQTPVRPIPVVKRGPQISSGRFGRRAEDSHEGFL